MFEPLLKTGQQTLKNKKSSGGVHRRMKDQFIYAIIIIMSVAFLCSVYACSRQQPSSIEELVKETHPSNLKILLVGIDGATFSVIKPMIKEGRLPQLKKLMDEGVQGILKSQEPMLSPCIWTSMVTGKDRKDHGIDSFVVSNPQLPNKNPRLMNSGHRKTLAIWNIIGPFAKSSGFIGWWTSWPAEKVYGWTISNYLRHDNILKWFPEGKVRDHLTYPEALTNELQPFMVNPMDPPLEEMCELVALTQEELEQVKAAQRAIMGNGLSVYKFSYSVQRSTEEMALHMLKKGQPDLMGIFLSVDQVSHHFWHFYRPDEFPPGSVDLIKAQRLGKLIPNLYEHEDRYLSRLLAATDPNTVVIIVSDHGFQAVRQKPELKPVSQVAGYFDTKQLNKKDTVAIGLSGDHHIDGIFIAQGGPIKKGEIVSASIFDVFPTILALMGLPVPVDAKGRVLTEIIEPAFLAKHPVKHIRSYEGLIKRTKPSVSKDIEPENLDMLRALGYIK
jgi:predicted AlkP superfamily phosphohydrolase/phosphomutase